MAPEIGLIDPRRKHESRRDFYSSRPAVKVVLWQVKLAKDMMTRVDRAKHFGHKKYMKKTTTFFFF